ncbi:hypothetical protein N7534_003620 [Penicillium rubens]|nr:hypothetical protein N7534_003620 [Penicillium rubens]
MYGYLFIARLPPHITLRTQKPMEKARIEAELHGELVHWYKVFGQFLKKNKIQAHELYNWDETGFQLGVGTKENVASTRENETIATGGIGQNITGIECISADGWVMHPWFLMCGSEQMEDWFDGDNDPSNYKVIKPTAKGWTDDKTAIQWLLDFHYTTKKRPLDGKPFSVLKQKFRKKNNEIVRWGGDVDDKRHFLRLIKTVRKDTFKSRTIKSSFYDTGIWPWNPHIVCDQIDPGWEDEPVLEIYGHTPSPEAEILSSVTNSPPNSDQRFSKIENKLQTIFENDEPDLPKVQKHINRAIHGGKQAIQDLALAKQTIKKMQSHKIPVKRSKRIIKGASKSHYRQLQAIRGFIDAVRRKQNWTLGMRVRTQGFETTGFGPTKLSKKKKRHQEVEIISM